MNPAARVKNTAGAQELAKCLKANLSNNLEDKLFLSADMDTNIASLHALLEDMMYHTLRPTESVLVEAIRFCYLRSKNEAKPYAAAIVSCFTRLRKKLHSTSTGKQLPEAAAKLIRTMKDLQNNRAAGRKGQDSQESQAAEPAASSLAVKLPVTATPLSKKGRVLLADDVPTPDQVLKLYGLGSEAVEMPASPPEIRGGRKRAVIGRLCFRPFFFGSRDAAEASEVEAICRA